MAKDAKIVLAGALAWSLSCAFSAGPALAAGAILFDTTDGHVLYAEDVDTGWYPASLTKMMTAYVAFQAVRDHKITLDTKIFISPHAQAQPPTRLGLKAGKDLPLVDALRALIMRSANDLAIAIAETVGGDEASFVKTMNQTAAQLGMLHTHFINPNGLPAEQQVTTPRDMALLAQALVRDFPEHGAMFSDTQAMIGKVSISTHNALLGSFQGADGIKTGYTCASGYNLVASATRDGHRLVAVVLGDETSAARNARAAALLEHGFKTREWKALVPDRAGGELSQRYCRRRLRAQRDHARALEGLPGFATACRRRRQGWQGRKKQQASVAETKKPVQRQARSSGSRKRRHARNE